MTTSQTLLRTSPSQRSSTGQPCSSSDVYVRLKVVGCRTRREKVSLEVAAYLPERRFAVGQQRQTRLSSAGHPFTDVCFSGIRIGCRVEIRVDVCVE